MDVVTEAVAFLGGGGSQTDERQVWREAFRAGDRVALWPFAQSGAERRRTVDWFRSALKEFGGPRCQVWGETASGRRLVGVDVVAVPGGNTFALLATLRRIGLFEALREFLAAGGRMYGGSAGAVLAGADIGVAERWDGNDVGLRECGGLDLVGGRDVLPHFTVGMVDEVRGMASRMRRPIICIAEDGGVMVDRGGGLLNLGPADVWEISGERTVRYPEGERWS